MKELTAFLFLGVLLALVLPEMSHAGEGPYSLSTISGTYECQITVFAWPHNREDPLLQNSQGTSETIADGAGNLTDGSMSLHSVRDPDQGIPCRYGLRHGTYQVSTDGSGRTEGEWKFMEGGGSGWKCFDTGLPRNSVQVGVVKPGPVFMENMLVTKSGARTYNVVYDQTGITISVCDRK